MANKEEAMRRLDRAFESGKEVCLIIWNVEDVIQVCKDHGKDISVEDAENVLSIAEYRHDACYGINWDVLWIFAQDIIAQREEEDAIETDSKLRAKFE